MTEAQSEIEKRAREDWLVARFQGKPIGAPDLSSVEALAAWIERVRNVAFLSGARGDGISVREAARMFPHLVALTPSQPAEEVREAVARVQEALTIPGYAVMIAGDLGVLITAALTSASTASAESVQKLTAERDELKLALAEADSKNDAMLHEWNSAEQLIHGVRAATIEECAKVAEAYPTSVSKPIGASMAKRVRALTKEPR